MKTAVQLEKPKTQRSYVTITDPETRKSVCQTLYGIKPDEVMQLLVEAINQRSQSRK